MKCKHCGTEIPDSSLYCLKCGGRIRTKTDVTPVAAPEEKPVKLVPGRFDLILGIASLLVMLLSLLFCVADFGHAAKRGLLYFTAIICLLCAGDCFFPELSIKLEELKARRQGFDIYAYSQSKHFGILRNITHLLIFALSLALFVLSFYKL